LSAGADLPTSFAFVEVGRRRSDNPLLEGSRIFAGGLIQY